MSGKIANPGALGLGAFALTTFLLSLINAGIIAPASIGVVLPMAFFYGGLALMIVLEAAGIISAVPPAGLASFLAAWGLFTLYATFAATKASKGLLALFIALTITFFLLAAGEYVSGFKLAGGYLGILVALIAWYDSAAILINDMSERRVLPF